MSTRRCTISNFTPSNPNPRKFSKGKEALSPEDVLYLYVQLQVEQSLTSINKTMSTLSYYAEEYPQAETKVVALSPNGSHAKLIVSLTLGEAREALSGVSEKVEACYGILNRISLSMYQNRPILSQPPTTLERQAWETLESRLS